MCWVVLLRYDQKGTRRGPGDDQKGTRREPEDDQKGTRRGPEDDQKGTRREPEDNQKGTGKLKPNGPAKLKNLWFSIDVNPKTNWAKGYQATTGATLC